MLNHSPHCASLASGCCHLSYASVHLSDTLHDDCVVFRSGSMVLLDLATYRALFYSCAAAIFALETCFLLLIPHCVLAELFEKVFQITRSGSNVLMMNFFGVNVDFGSSRRLRLSLIGQLATIASINILLFVDGCVIQVQHLSGEDLCPKANSDCFLMGVKGVSSHSRVPCELGQAMSNSTTSYVACFIWVYGEQNAMSVINQIGICSSVFSLMCHALRASCRLSHKWWGLLILTLIALGSLAALIVLMVIELKVSVIALLLLMGCTILLFNVIQLFQFIHHREKRQQHCIKK